jgi:hypothetical protein
MNTFKTAKYQEGRFLSKNVGASIILITVADLCGLPGNMDLPVRHRL